MKYLTMICQGHVPQRLAAKGAGKVLNDDSRQFIQYFLPAGAKLTKPMLSTICRSFHLAFQGMDTDEIYDVLMEQLLRAAQKYDPLYSQKMRQVVGVLGQLGERFTVNELNQQLEFDGARFVRVLCRHGFLEPVAAGEKGPGGDRYYRRKAGCFPPPAKYLAAGPIGFTYYLQKWFRYYLQTFIEQSMSRIESKEGVYSLSYTRDAEDGRGGCELLDARGAVVNPGVLVRTGNAEMTARGPIGAYAFISHLTDS